MSYFSLCIIIKPLHFRNINLVHARSNTNFPAFLTILGWTLFVRSQRLNCNMLEEYPQEAFNPFPLVLQSLCDFFSPFSFWYSVGPL